MAQDTNNENRHNGEMPLARKVGRMGVLIHRYYEAQAQRHGAMGDPTRGQGRVLALLKAKPETTQRELSYLLDMRQQSLSELLAKLEEKGFVTREKSAEDGRVTVVRLTEQGAEAAPSPEQMSQRADALDCLSEEEQAQLEALTSKVTTSLEQKLEEMGIDPHQGPRGPHGPQRDRDGRSRDGRDGRDRDGRGPHGKGRGKGFDRDQHDSRRPYDRDRDRGQRDSRRPYDRDRDRDQRDSRGSYGHNDASHRGPYRPHNDRNDGRTWQA